MSNNWQSSTNKRAFEGFQVSTTKKFKSATDNEDEKSREVRKLDPSKLLNDREASMFVTHVDDGTTNEQQQQQTNVTMNVSTISKPQQIQQIPQQNHQIVYQQQSQVQQQPPQVQQQVQQQEEEEDPLDAFMKDIQKTVEKKTTTTPTNTTSNILPNQKQEQKLRRADIEDEDDFDTFMKYRKELESRGQLQPIGETTTRKDDEDYNSDEEVYAAARLAAQRQSKNKNGGGGNSDDENEDDFDENRKKDIGPLAALEHSTLTYEPFNKNFYQNENSEIKALNEQQVQQIRRSMDINVTGINVAKPVKRWDQLPFDKVLMAEIKKQGYEEPTTIQKQAIPIALSGRDIIGLAKTGSGKTAAFVLPMIVHIMDQPELEYWEGPIGIILAPTRELADQIFNEAKKFAKPYGLRVGAIYGGVPKYDQIKTMKAGVEIVVSTPGRLIDMIKGKHCPMRRVTMLILDEADRMFDLGFEPQIRSVVGQIRPDRQTLLFSATFKKKVESLARDILSDPVRINVGTQGASNEDIKQIVYVLKDSEQKAPWLIGQLRNFAANGSVLIFVGTKADADNLTSKLKLENYHVAALHGDVQQTERTAINFAFKNGNLPILVATDVAARGLDIKHIKTVINYDAARNIDSHVHRIGRTGRMGDKDGVAITLITKQESNFAAELLRNLEASNQEVTPELFNLAMQNPWFRKQREQFGKSWSSVGGGAANSMGRGRGRAGIGSSSTTTTATNTMNKTGGSGNYHQAQQQQQRGGGIGSGGRGKGGQQQSGYGKSVGGKPLSNFFVKASNNND